MSIISAVSASRNKRHLSIDGSIILLSMLRWRLVRVMACSLFIVLALPCLAGKTASAASITLTVPGKLTLSAVADGQFHESSAATVSVKSDAHAGYTLSIGGSEDTNAALKNGSNTIPSISSAMAGSSFPVNTWGWLPSKLDSQENKLYQPGPTKTLVTIDETDSANPDANNDYTFTLGAKVNGEVPAGTYVNTFTFTATANPVPYTITYKGDAVPDKQTGTGMEGTWITLADAPERENYEFKGWCNVETTDEKCDGKDAPTYEADGKYVLTNSDNNVTLWAMWKQQAFPMQSWGWNECSKLTTGDTVTLIDTRDNNTYRARKFADNKCWMIDNLRLGDSKLANRTLTSANTDLNNIDSYDLPESRKVGFQVSPYNYGAENIYVVEADSEDGTELKAYGGYYTWSAATAGGSTSGNNAPLNSICPKGWRLPFGGTSNNEFKMLNDVLGGITNSDANLTNPDGPNFLRAGQYSSSIYDSDQNAEPRGQGQYGYYWSSTRSTFSNSYELYFYDTDVNFTTALSDWYYGNSVRCLVAEPHSISYNLNGASSGPSPNPQTGREIGGDIKLSSVIPVRSGYCFKGWCSVDNTGDPSSCTGTTYEAGASYSLSPDNLSLTLYAIWQQAPSVTPTTMQNFSAGCYCEGRMTIGQTMSLPDTRDNNTYRIRKLADGQCWMVDNLRLGDSKLTDRLLTSANTDLNNYLNTYKLPSSSKNGFTSSYANTQDIYVVEADSEDRTELKDYGGYYTYNAATAGTGASVTSANAPSSICPRGWRLPAGTSGDFRALNDALGSITDGDGHLINPDGPAFLRAGYYDDGSAVYQGSDGYYWSSMAGSSNYAYRLHFSDDDNKFDTSNRYKGLSVRCVARDPSDLYSITYNLTGGSGGPNPNPQEGATKEATITLDSAKPTKCGYDFQYWCSVDNSANPTACSGTHYNAGASYNLSNGANPTLYAVWKTTGTDLGNLGTMQSFTCSSRIPSVGGFGTVTDTRDNNTYCVRKLKDNKCWMTSNLRLGDSKLQNRTLTPDNTDLNGISSYDLPSSSQSGFSSGNNAVQNIYVVEADSEDRTELKDYGGYYTFNAATAGTGASVTSRGDEAPSSICPKGWRLPTGNTSGDFKALNDALGTPAGDKDAYLTNPDGPNFLRAGGYYNNKATDQGSNGGYWASTAYSSSNAYTLYFRSSSVMSTNNSARYRGYPIRCIAK